jgi:uncharacterized membrane protein
MTAARWFWWLLCMVCVIWYSTITVYVAIRGWFDIRGMLGRLKDNSGEAEATEDRCA